LLASERFEDRALLAWLCAVVAVLSLLPLVRLVIEGVAPGGTPSAAALTRVLASNTTWLATGHSLVTAFGGTLVAVAIVFRYLYHPRFGGLNRVLDFLGISPIDWLGDPRWAMPAIILLAVWKNFGYAMILFIAGLQAIPESLYEAARLDGAGSLQVFRKITLPMLAPTLLFLGIMTTIGYFQFFAEPYVMTGGGGPLNATLSTGLLMYKQGFRWWNMGYAATIAVVLGLVIFAFSALQFRIERRRNA